MSNDNRSKTEILWRICHFSIQLHFKYIKKWRKYRPDSPPSLTHFWGFHHSVPLCGCSSSRSMLSVRSATSALLLRTGTQIATVRAVPRFGSSPIRLCGPPPLRALSLSACLWKKKKRSACLEMTQGQNMDSSIEEVLAPLRLAVKEQVTRLWKTITSVRNVLHYYFTELHIALNTYLLFIRGRVMI